MKCRSTYIKEGAGKPAYLLMVAETRISGNKWNVDCLFSKNVLKYYNKMIHWMGFRMEKIGVLTKRVIDEFQLSYDVGTEILLGPSNVSHMQTEHPADYAKYKDKIADIISNPTYICQHPQNDSIEYIKVLTDANGEHVLVAVRASGADILFARTVFEMSPDKIRKYQQKKVFIPY